MCNRLSEEYHSSSLKELCSCVSCSLVLNCVPKTLPSKSIDVLTSDGGGRLTLLQYISASSKKGQKHRGDQVAVSQYCVIQRRVTYILPDYMHFSYLIACSAYMFLCMERNLEKQNKASYCMHESYKNISSTYRTQ